MAILPIPSFKKRYTTVYNSFRGVDLSGDSTKIDNTRSPWAPNLVSDKGGLPEKRVGWRRLARVEAPVNGLFYLSLNGEDHWLVHGGTKLYRWHPEQEDGAPETLYGAIHSAPSSAFASGGRLYILTGREYLCYDGAQVRRVADLATVPTVTISRPPAGGGVLYQQVNLLQPKRTDSFLSDGSSKTYQLSATGIDAVTQVLVDGVATSIAYTVDTAGGSVTFASAPPAPQVAGQDNVQITFSKRVEGYAERINGCRFWARYGTGGADHHFVAGNPNHPNRDWHCALKDPTYFPDLGYADVGAEGTAITGYAQVGETLAILKGENAQDATIFLRSVQSLEGEVLFPLRQGVAGVGSLTHRAVGNIQDEPLFLSRTGVYAITTGSIYQERVVQNRSYFVDPALCREQGLERAVAVAWQGRYLVCVNGNCYVLDGTQRKAWRSQSEGDYVYECYHWSNIPASCFLEHDGQLFFGTETGMVCRFNTDLPAPDCYHDNGQAIACMWSTKEDDDGDFMQRKALCRRGCGIQIKPSAGGSVRVLLDTEEQRGVEALHSVNGRFDWNSIDFARFTFQTGDGAPILPFDRICGPYMMLQIAVVNEQLHEGLGILSIVKRYTRGRAKR